MTYCCDCYYYREDREGGGCYEPDRPVNKRAVGWLSPACNKAKPKEDKTMDQEKKTCTKCGRELPLSEFSRNRYGLLSVCKTCCKEGRLASRKKPEPADSAILRIPKTESQIDTRFFFGNVPDEELVAELRNRGYEVTCTKTITL